MISFIISTNGKHPLQLSCAIKSIRYAASFTDIAYEIILVGYTKSFANIDNRLICIECDKASQQNYWGLGKNIGARFSHFSNLVFMSDKILLEPSWIQRFIQFKDWDVCSCKILTPSGGRYFDKSTSCPHELVVYDCPDNLPHLYFTRDFFIINKDVWQQHAWRNFIKSESYMKGDISFNEDVEYCERLIERGYTLRFDSENTVWYWDYTYIQQGNNTIRLPYNQTTPIEYKEFTHTLRDIYSWDNI